MDLFGIANFALTVACKCQPGSANIDLRWQGSNRQPYGSSR